MIHKKITKLVLDSDKSDAKSLSEAQRRLKRFNWYLDSIISRLYQLIQLS